VNPVFGRPAADVRWGRWPPPLRWARRHTVPIGRARCDAVLVGCGRGIDRWGTARGSSLPRNQQPVPGVLVGRMERGERADPGGHRSAAQREGATWPRTVRGGSVRFEEQKSSNTACYSTITFRAWMGARRRSEDRAGKFLTGDGSASSRHGSSSPRRWMTVQVEGGIRAA
jgi:hypothetical protein